MTPIANRRSLAPSEYCLKNNANAWKPPGLAYSIVTFSADSINLLFAVLYSKKRSRPNIPVNVLIAMDFLKAGHGWSDEEMYDQFQYNLQVRYALGLHDFDTGQFELRTVYNFRQRLSLSKRTGTRLAGQAVCPGHR